MSGIVGIFNTDGAPVSRDCLVHLTASLKFRGPDSQRVWCDFEVGFGHALLDTSGGTTTDEQPCSLDGKVWIVADARVDARPELSEKLRSAGISVPPGASDAQWVLFAYQAWGQDCVHHLLGDFAFAIWDKRRKQLFCARDHFGVKPFYYSNPRGSFVFSNTLNCLRLHPSVAARLNDLAVCDYLLFGGNQDPRTTSFEEIQRLPPGHLLLCSEGRVKISQYWTLPRTSELAFKKAQDYIDRFRSLLGIAVQDRLPPGPVAISMSGGLDSGAVAAVAGRLLGDDPNSRLHAYSAVYDRLIPDQERQFADKTAAFCGIPIHYLVADGYQLFQNWREGHPGPAELCDQPMLAISGDLYKQIAVHSRVTFTGEGGDPCLLPSPAAILKLLRTGRLLYLTTGYLRCSIWQRTIPRVGFRTLIRGRTKNTEGAVPEWINPNLALKLDLSHRANEFQLELGPAGNRRPEACNKLTNGCWANHFELYDPANFPRPVENRNPFFDIRLVDFLFNLPTLPWCVGKQIIREGMAGFLPPEVLRRRKTALAGDPVVKLLKQPQSAWIDSFQPTPELLHYVIPSRIPSITKNPTGSAEAWLNLRPLTLDHWLRTRAMLGYKSRV